MREVRISFSETDEKNGKLIDLMEMEEDELSRIKDQEVIQDHEEEQEEIKMKKN